MPKILMIRPCETDYFHAGRMLGRKDVDLNSSGHMQAEALAEYLKNWPLGFMAVSPLKRAISTAMPICEPHHLSPRLVSGFQALDLGDWEDRELLAVRSEDKGRFASFKIDPDFPSPGGESLRNVFARTYSDLLDLIEYTQPGEVLCLVVQETVMQVMCCMLLDLPLSSASRFTMEPGAIALFERPFYDEPYQLKMWNDTHHFESLLSGTAGGSV